MKEDEIREYLLVNGWREFNDKNGYFRRNPLELVILTTDNISYWEDIRAVSTRCKFDLPISFEDLRNLLL